MVKRTIFSIATLLGAVYIFHDLPEYRYTITLLVGVPLAVLAIIVERKHIFRLACCSVCCLVGAAFTPVYCDKGNTGLGFDAASVIWNVILGGGVGMVLNAVQSQLINADRDLLSRNVTPIPTKGEP